ncbi:MAG: dTDP-4-dehydrorhamnose 3,5-epimerase [Reichenbachiella sp.]
MTVNELPLIGAFGIQPQILEDKRGYFFEWFNLEKFKSQSGVDFTPVQFNSSRSSRGVLRGLHFQKDPVSQSKVVGVTHGTIQDVIVDIREGSPTYGQHYSEIIDDQKKNQLYIPKGFAHGFLVLSEEAEIFYAIDNYYSPGNEGGLKFDDPDLDINWEIENKKIVLSDKDLTYKPLSAEDFNFKYND